MKKKYLFLSIMHLFIGVGAIIGGLAGIVEPGEPLGLPAYLLDGSIFSSYLVPGIILFIFIGLGNVFSALTAWNKSAYQGYISSVFSWGLMIFIIVQCLVMKSVVFPHVFFFLLGLTGAILAGLILINNNQFPINILRRKINVS